MTRGKASSEEPPGTFVLYRVGGTDETPELRPAVVVRSWSADSINAQVFVDGSNDLRHTYPDGEAMFDKPACVRGLAWKTSITRGDAVGQWRSAPGGT